MLSAARKALCAGTNWLWWRQYSLIRPVAGVVKIQLQGQNRACMDIPPNATKKFNWFPGPSKRKFHISTDLQGKVVPFLLADVGEGIQTVEIKEWLVKVGDTVTMGDAVCEVQSDKAAVTIYVAYDGIVKELMYEVDDVATAGQPLLTIELAEEQDEGEESSSGCISKVDQDTLDSVTNQETTQTPVSSAPTATTPTSILPVTNIPSPVNFTHDKVEPVKGIQAVMVKTMTASGQIPQFGYCDEVDMTNVVKLKSHVKEQLLQKGIKFSYMPFIIKAVSTALHHFPILNSHTDPECTTVTYKADHNIGVAMDMPQGLVVPNIKQCQLKSVLEIAVELNHIHELGLKNQLTPNDMTGGTFSLSNIGALGGTYTKPMLLPPEVAIGGLGKVQILPRYDSKGNLKKAHIMHVSWSADHRVIEGATVARFSNLWKSYFEDPTTLINTDLDV